MSTKVAVIYQNVPEDCHTYILDLNEKELELVKRCHNVLVNFNNDDTNQDAVDWLSIYLEDKHKFGEVGPVDLTEVSLLVVTGFHL